MNEPIIVKQSVKGNILYCIGAFVLAFLGLIPIFFDFRQSTGIYGLITKSNIGYIALKVIFGLCFVFFSYCFFFVVKKAKQGKDILIVDENGVTDNSSALAFGFIPWQDIDEIFIKSLMGNDFIEIVLNNEEEYLDKLPLLKKKAVLINKKMGHEIICITLNSTGVSPHKLMSGIYDYFLKSKSKSNQ